MNHQPRAVILSLCVQLQNQPNYPVQIPQKAIDRYNSTISHLPELHPGDTVRLRKNKKDRGKKELFRNKRVPVLIVLRQRMKNFFLEIEDICSKHLKHSQQDLHLILKF